MRAKLMNMHIDGKGKDQDQDKDTDGKDKGKGHGGPEGHGQLPEDIAIVRARDFTPNTSSLWYEKQTDRIRASHTSEGVRESKSWSCKMPGGDTKMHQGGHRVALVTICQLRWRRA